MQAIKWILGLSGGVLSYLAAGSEDLAQVFALGGIGIGLLLASLIVRELQTKKTAASGNDTDDGKR